MGFLLLLLLLLLLIMVVLRALVRSRRSTEMMVSCCRPGHFPSAVLPSAPAARAQVEEAGPPLGVADLLSGGVAGKSVFLCLPLSSSLVSFVLLYLWCVVVVQCCCCWPEFV